MMTRRYFNVRFFLVTSAMLLVLALFKMGVI